ncbi:MAG: hypothetical protein RSB08_04205, partial [Clostridia bacterium]
MPKIKIHPLFIVLSAVIVWLSGILNFASAILAVLLHEFAHSLIARERGYVANKITLLPYGAMLLSEENLDKTSNLLIALAGPLANFLIALMTVATWWIFPSSYPYTEYFVRANLTIGIFNLIPVFPLDGARIVLSYGQNTAKTLKLLRRFGIALSFAMFSLFIVSAFYTINLTVGILAVFLYIGAISGTKNEMYAHILKCSPLTKSFNHGVRAQTLYIADTLTLSRILKLVNSKH